VLGACNPRKLAFDVVERAAPGHPGGELAYQPLFRGDAVLGEDQVLHPAIRLARHARLASPCRSSASATAATNDASHPIRCASSFIDPVRSAYACRLGRAGS
jgi:hypothetical protein